MLPNVASILSVEVIYFARLSFIEPPGQYNFFTASTEIKVSNKDFFKSVKRNVLYFFTHKWSFVTRNAIYRRVVLKRMLIFEMTIDDTVLLNKINMYFFFQGFISTIELST